MNRQTVLLLLCMVPMPPCLIAFVLYMFGRFFLSVTRWGLAVLSVDLDQTVCPNFLKVALGPER